MKSRDKIIQAAIAVFAEKGKHGARMEEIAANAEINKSMLYYYFSTKDNLYTETIRYIIISKFFTVIMSSISKFREISDPVKKVRLLSHTYFKLFSRNAMYTKILMEALSNYPEEVSGIMKSFKKETGKSFPKIVLGLIEEGKAKGVFRDIDSRQAIVSLVAMNLFYFLAKPMAKVMLELSEENEELFLKEREEKVIDLFLNGILAGGEK